MRITLLILILSTVSCGNSEKKEDTRKTTDAPVANQTGDDTAHDTTDSLNEDGEVDNKTSNSDTVGINLIIGNGGFLSCNSDSQKATMTKITSAIKVKLALGSDKEPVIIETCFGDSHTEINYRILGKINDWSPTTVEQLVKIVNEMSGTSTLSDVYFTGYSYGGWLALTLATKLEMDRNLVNLVTIDSISPNGCNISNILQSPPGCKQAPSDFTLEQKDQLALRTNWVNFYQDNFSYLHSSEITEADSNFKKTYEPGTPFGGNAHDDIARDPEVLEEILLDI